MLFIARAVFLALIVLSFFFFFGGGFFFAIVIAGAGEQWRFYITASLLSMTIVFNSANFFSRFFAFSKARIGSWRFTKHSHFGFPVSDILCTRLC